MLAFSIMFFSGRASLFSAWLGRWRPPRQNLPPHPGNRQFSRRDRRLRGARHCLSRPVARHEAWLTISGRGFARCAILFQPGDIASEHPEFPPRSDRLGGRPQPCRMGLLSPRPHSGKGCARSGVRPHFVWDRFSDLRGAELSRDRSETRTRRAKLRRRERFRTELAGSSWTLRRGAGGGAKRSLWPVESRSCRRAIGSTSSSCIT